jgi:ribosomal protein S18 acetylase RimI-like enzyme
MTGLRILHGLPPDLRGDAARLYWQAFGPKLGRVMGPDHRALAYLDATIMPDHAMVALSDDGALIGIAGFKTARGTFAGGGFGDLRRCYGLPGAMWRGAALWCLSREVDNNRFLFDGIVVDRGARGRGVGTRLIESVAELAAAQGYRELRLEVIDTNIRARALYERLGFRAAGVHRMGPLRHLFGFDAAVTMVRAV